MDTFPETASAIRARMTAKWQDDPDAFQRVQSSVTNSLRRSAGTNYQGLVAYAIARYLFEHGSSWYVVHPVPPDWGYMLSIKFTAGVDATDEVDTATEDGESAGDDDAVSVKPDLDILIRNAAWPENTNDDEPVLVLSVKTSLADRAGSAARWKTYFDLVTRPCQHVGERTCAYRRLGIELANAPAVHLVHGIVTANIYKINSDPYFARYGELRSNQSRANTFMFDLRYTTREESADVMADGWESLVHLPEWLTETSAEFDLPD